MRPWQPTNGGGLRRAASERRRHRRMTDTTIADRNKELTVRGFTEFAAGNIEVLRTLLREDFIEHSPGNPSGRDAFIEFIANAPVAGARLDLKRVIADDRYAVVHYHMISPGDERGV